MQLTTTTLLSQTWYEYTRLVMWPVIEHQLIFIPKAGVLFRSAQIFGTSCFHSNGCPKKWEKLEGSGGKWLSGPSRVFSNVALRVSSSFWSHAFVAGFSDKHLGWLSEGVLKAMFRYSTKGVTVFTLAWIPMVVLVLEY